MSKRQTKDLLYEQVARIGKAVSSPKRLELLEILAQGEKTVDALAAEASIDIKLASAHLKVLKEARLVESQRDGRFIAYRLSGEDVSALWVMLRTVAEEHLVELKVALDRIFAAPEKLDAETRRSLMEKARRGDVVVIEGAGSPAEINLLDCDIVNLRVARSHVGNDKETIVGGLAKIHALDRARINGGRMVALVQVLGLVDMPQGDVIQTRIAHHRPGQGPRGHRVGEHERDDAGRASGGAQETVRVV